MMALFNFTAASNGELYEALSMIANVNTPLVSYMEVLTRYIKPGALGVDWTDRYGFTALPGKMVLELQSLFSTSLAQEYRARGLTVE